MFSLWVIIAAATCAILTLAVRSLPSTADILPENEPASPVAEAKIKPESPVAEVKRVKRVTFFDDDYRIDLDPFNTRLERLRKGTAVPTEAEFNPAIHICRRRACYDCFDRYGRVPCQKPQKRYAPTVFPISGRFMMDEEG